MTDPGKLDYQTQRPGSLPGRCALKVQSQRVSPAHWGLLAVMTRETAAMEAAKAA